MAWKRLQPRRKISPVRTICGVLAFSNALHGISKTIKQMTTMRRAMLKSFPFIWRSSWMPKMFALPMFPRSTTETIQRENKAGKTWRSIFQINFRYSSGECDMGIGDAGEDNSKTPSFTLSLLMSSDSFSIAICFRYSVEDWRIPIKNQGRKEGRKTGRIEQVLSGFDRRNGLKISEFGSN